MVLGSINEETSFCSRVSRAVGCVVIAVEYRLAPEHVFPAGTEDAWNGVSAGIGVEETALY